MPAPLLSSADSSYSVLSALAVIVIVVSRQRGSNCLNFSHRVRSDDRMKRETGRDRRTTRNRALDNGPCMICSQPAPQPQVRADALTSHDPQAGSSPAHTPPSGYCRQLRSQMQNSRKKMRNTIFRVAALLQRHDPAHAEQIHVVSDSRHPSLVIDHEQAPAGEADIDARSNPLQRSVAEQRMTMLERVVPH